MRCSRWWGTRVYSPCMGASRFPRRGRSCCPATRTRTRRSTVLHTRPPARSSPVCSVTCATRWQQPLECNWPLRAKKTKTNYLATRGSFRSPTSNCPRAEKNAKDRIFITDTLPYLVWTGVVLFGVPATSHYLGCYARPPGRFPGLRLVGAASSWKTWPLPNVWQVEDIVFAVWLGSVVYTTVHYSAVQCSAVQTSQMYRRELHWREVSSLMLCCIT